MSTYRFERRSTTPGDYRFVTGFFAGLAPAANVLFGVDRGDGSLGTMLATSSIDTDASIVLTNEVNLTQTIRGELQ